MKRVMYTQIKYFESGTRELYVKLKKKRKKIPSSRIRTSDLRISIHLLQSSALTTELSKEGVCNYDLSGWTLFLAKLVGYRKNLLDSIFSFHKVTRIRVSWKT